MVEAAKATSEFIFAELEKAKKAEAEKRLTEELDEARRAVRRTIREGSAKVDPVEEKKDEKFFVLFLPVGNVFY